MNEYEIEEHFKDKTLYDICRAIIDTLGGKGPTSMEYTRKLVSIASGRATNLATVSLMLGRANVEERHKASAELIKGLPMYVGVTDNVWPLLVKHAEMSQTHYLVIKREASVDSIEMKVEIK